MGNLLPTFPELDGPSFEPWVNPADADRDGISVGELAGNTADMWKDGLDGWSRAGSSASQYGNDDHRRHDDRSGAPDDQIAVVLSETVDGPNRRLGHRHNPRQDRDP